MNYVPQINRRAFVVSAAAFGGGLALGVDLPFGANVVRAADGSPEVTAWVVIKPDDSVVIRVARSEMGQGSMTGLAQLVAEELECDWSKVTTEYPTPGENLARNRVWGDISPPAAAPSANRNEYVRKGGATARTMLVAGRGQRVEGAGIGVQRIEQRDHAQARPGERRPSARSPKPLQRSSRPRTCTLKDPKDWKIAGKPVKRLDTARQARPARRSTASI